jgi:hypothetical protein
MLWIFQNKVKSACCVQHNRMPVPRAEERQIRGKGGRSLACVEQPDVAGYLTGGTSFLGFFTSLFLRC